MKRHALLIEPEVHDARKHLPGNVRQRMKRAEVMSDPQMLLESPCLFPLKAIGTGTDDFESLVVSIVRQHVPDFGEGAISTRPSGGGKYLAVTVTFVAESKAQVDALYQELSDHERVVMVL